MRLSKILQKLDNYEIFGKENILLSSISDDSRKTKKGSLFIAVKGLTHDGHNFIPQVIKKGALAVIGENEPESNWLKKITYVKVKDSRLALAKVASSWYGDPSRKLYVIGVTGTKGKTTTVHMLNHILNYWGKKCGMISSITYPGLHVTTPGPLEINKILRKILDKGIKYAILEVSSHGIDQMRIAGIFFRIGILTNISPEHLDYHKTFNRYKETKLKFINSCEKKIICPKVTKIDIFPGYFNNLNAEAAVLAGRIIGIKRKDALKSLLSFKLPKGRLDEIKNNKGFRIFIDFAHTPDSLENVLSYLKLITKGKLIVIFGCAGERYREKRSIMGGISARIAEISVFTAEDPRNEDVEKIIDEMVVGALRNKAKEMNYHNLENLDIRKGEHFFCRVAERGEAISLVLQKIAKKDDIIVICGKGHEKSMAYRNIEYPWSDYEAVKIALKGGVKKIFRN